MKEFGQINDVFSKCCLLAPRQPLPDNQLILMTNASFKAAEYAVSDPIGKFPSTGKRMPQ